MRPFGRRLKPVVQRRHPQSPGTSPRPGHRPPRLWSWLQCTRCAPRLSPLPLEWSPGFDWKRRGVSLCLRSPVCCQKPLLSCPALPASDSSLRPSGDAGATLQRCCPTWRTRDQALPSSSVRKAFPRTQAFRSAAALNFGKKIWRGLTWACSTNGLACQ